MFQNLETACPDLFPPSRFYYKHKTFRCVPLILCSGKTQKYFCRHRSLAQQRRLRNLLCLMTELQPYFETLCFLNKNGQQGKKGARVTSEHLLLASSPCLSFPEQKVLKLKTAPSGSRDAPNFRHDSFAKRC